MRRRPSRPNAHPEGRTAKERRAGRGRGIRPRERDSCHELAHSRAFRAAPGRLTQLGESILGDRIAYGGRLRVVIQEFEKFGADRRLVYADTIDVDR